MSEALSDAERSVLERTVLAGLDVEGMLDFLGELVAVRSLGGEETPAQELVAAKMESLGLHTDVWEIDFGELARHPAYCAEVERRHGLGVVGSLGEGDGPTLVLNGHVDVVPAGDPGRWTHPPFAATRKDGRIYGRGACDMKGGLCCALFAAAALRKAGLRGRLLVESVVGEEDGGAGTLAAILRGYRADGAVVPEPTALKVVPAQAGALGFRIRVPGKAAHACVRTEGVSAVERFWAVHQALLLHEREINDACDHPLLAGYDLPYPLSIGTLRAGEYPSAVPEELVCEGRYGIPLGEDLGEARRRFERVVAEAARADPWLRDHPPEVEWWGGQFAPAETPAEEAVVTELCRAFVDATGRDAEVEGVPYGADMRLLVNEGGIPTVLFGPGDVRRAHRPDEFVPVEELVTAARTLVLLAIRFCGAAS